MAPQQTQLSDSPPIEYRVVDNKISMITVGDMKAKLRAGARDALCYSVRHEYWEGARDGVPIVADKQVAFDLVRDMTEPLREKNGINVITDEVARLQTLCLIDAGLHVYDHDSFLEILETVGEIVRDNATSEGKVRASRVLDAAPRLFLWQEAMKMTTKVIEEAFTELYARSFLPVVNYNTWFETYSYERDQDLDHGVAQYVNVAALPSSSGRQSENREPVLRKLVFFDADASWTSMELLRYAEAMQHGAPRKALNTSRMARARKKLAHWENVLLMFGDSNVGIKGILSPGTGIPTAPAAVKLGAPGSTGEDDRRLIVDHVANRIDTTAEIYKPDFVALGLKSWLWANKQIFGTLASGDGTTVAEAILRSIMPMGVSSLALIPELGFRQAEADRMEAKGLSTAEAERIAGGIDKKDCMLVMKRSSEIGEGVIGKDVTMLPEELTSRGTTEMRWVQSCGGYEVYQPEGHEITTDIGPDSLFDAP